MDPRRREELLTWLDSPPPAAPAGRAGDSPPADEENLHRHLLEQLVHLEVPEEEARRYWSEVSDRRLDLRRRLGRDPGIRVAALDYLMNDRRILIRPVAVEEASLEQAERTAAEDGLTGLVSPRHFQSAVRCEVRRARRRLQQFSLVWLQVDRWFELRTDHGLPAADSIQRKLAGVLQGRLRDMDLAARIEEGRFALLLPLTRRTGAFVASDRIRVAARELFRRPGIVIPGRIPVSLSGGIAQFPDDGDSADRLLSRARQAAGGAGRTGGDRIVPFHEERRAALRISPAGSPLLATVVRNGGDRLRMRVLDFGEGGALLEGEGVLPAGEEITVQFEAPPDAPGLELPARIERWDPVAPGETPVHRAAVSFPPAAAGLGEALRDLLDRVRRAGVE